MTLRWKALLIWNWIFRVFLLSSSGDRWCFLSKPQLLLLRNNNGLDGYLGLTFLITICWPAAHCSIVFSSTMICILGFQSERERESDGKTQSAIVIVTTRTIVTSTAFILNNGQKANLSRTKSAYTGGGRAVTVQVCHMSLKITPETSSCWNTHNDILS